MDFKPFSLTHVQYLKSDKYLGFLFSLITLTPILLLFSYFTFLLFICIHVLGFSSNNNSKSEIKRLLLDWIKWIGMALSGQLSNEVLNFGLKEFIKEERPQSPVNSAKSTYGMPSSHSQFMWYIAGLLLVWFYSSKSELAKTPPTLRLFILIGICLLSGAVSYSRVYLEYHSERQVIAGGVLGFIYGIVFGIIVLPILVGGAKKKRN